MGLSGISLTSEFTLYIVSHCYCPRPLMELRRSPSRRFCCQSEESKKSSRMVLLNQSRAERLQSPKIRMYPNVTLCGPGFRHSSDETHLQTLVSIFISCLRVWPRVALEAMAAVRLISPIACRYSYLHGKFSDREDSFEADILTARSLFRSCGLSRLP